VVVDDTAEMAREAAAGLLRRDIWQRMSVNELAERGIAFIGTPADVLSGMMRFVDAGVEYFTVSFMPIRGYKATLRQMRLFKPVLEFLSGT
jgi:alkanesulfonate monooxygenase SsuD/methylene tetrahydromethanopterin reductase-like flavin-dependent oxidoreductase (luciferase family)